MAIAVREYVDHLGNSPFRDWLRKLDVSVRARIQARIMGFEDIERAKAYWASYTEGTAHGKTK